MMKTTTQLPPAPPPPPPPPSEPRDTAQRYSYKIKMHHEIVKLYTAVRLVRSAINDQRGSVYNDIAKSKMDSFCVRRCRKCPDCGDIINDCQRFFSQVAK
ncbi:unnamed protein product [Ceratitis capitata]|uniref:(Mediterranean fruit fly) hypothetical protein n=1 Tax=Ceratitis capitata TaxID=7213 RepID=A0A811U2Z4_CERCA|nr:unnamed protein product [Ceratitis capitata]